MSGTAYLKHAISFAFKGTNSSKSYIFLCDIF